MTSVLSIPYLRLVFYSTFVAIKYDSVLLYNNVCYL